MISNTKGVRLGFNIIITLVDFDVMIQWIDHYFKLFNHIILWQWDCGITNCHSIRNSIVTFMTPQNHMGIYNPTT